MSEAISIYIYTFFALIIHVTLAPRGVFFYEGKKNTDRAKGAATPASHGCNETDGRSSVFSTSLHLEGGPNMLKTTCKWL